MLVARRITHKGLRLLYEDDDHSKIDARWIPKIKRLLAALNVIAAPEELDLPGYRFHQLTGDRKGTFALTVTKNRRITFQWDADGPHGVDLEDYH